MKFYADFWTRCLDFEGRTNRSDFWLTVLVNVIIGCILQYIIGFDTSILANLLYLIFSILSLIPGIAISIRRLHDIGKSGLNLLLIFIPVIGPIILLIFYCRPSVEIPNDQEQVVRLSGNKYANLLTIIGILEIVEHIFFLGRVYFLSNIRIVSVMCNLYFKYYLYYVLPVTGCIISILYFIKNNALKRRIQWEYMGIVISFYELIYKLFYKFCVFFSK